MRALAIVTLLVAVLAAACSGGTSTSSSRADRQAQRDARRAQRQCQRRGTCTSDTVTVPPSSVVPEDTGPLKPALGGLLDRDGEPPAPYLGVAVHGWVVKAYWKDLQPTAGGPIAANNVIDQAIAAARRLNAANPSLGLGLKLRIYAGIYAPDWAKNLAGGPVNVANPQDQQQGTVGRFWTDDFGRAYADLEQKLAAKYDDVPELREVVVSRCTTFFAEPFIRDKGDKGSIANLLGAGFSFTADQSCHHQEIDAHKVWRHTHSDLDFSPYQNIERKGVRSVDEGFTESMMDYCRATLGPRCVLGNNSIRSPVQPGYQPMYDRIKALGPPISFQTANPNKIGDLLATLQWAIGEGANSVELPGSYQQQSPQTFAPANSGLAANRA